MELARRYFAQAAKLNPTNIRALYGVFLVQIICCLNIFTLWVLTVNV